MAKNPLLKKASNGTLIPADGRTRDDINRVLNESKANTAKTRLAAGKKWFDSYVAYLHKLGFSPDTSQTSADGFVTSFKSKTVSPKSIRDYFKQQGFVNRDGRTYMAHTGNPHVNLDGPQGTVQISWYPKGGPTGVTFMTTDEMSVKHEGAVCGECGRTVSEGEYSSGASNCCKADVVPEEEYGKTAGAEPPGEMSKPHEGAVCGECGRTVTNGEYSSGESTCCKAGVVPEEEFGKTGKVNADIQPPKQLECCGGYHGKHRSECPEYNKNFNQVLETLKRLPKRSFRNLHQIPIGKLTDSELIEALDEIDRIHSDHGESSDASQRYRDQLEAEFGRRKLAKVGPTHLTVILHGNTMNFTKEDLQEMLDRSEDFRMADNLPVWVQRALIGTEAVPKVPRERGKEYSNQAFDRAYAAALKKIEGWMNSPTPVKITISERYPEGSQPSRERGWTRTLKEGAADDYYAYECKNCEFAGDYEASQKHQQDTGHESEQRVYDAKRYAAMPDDAKENLLEHAEGKTDEELEQELPQTGPSREWLRRRKSGEHTPWADKQFAPRYWDQLDAKGRQKWLRSGNSLMFYKPWAELDEQEKAKVFNALRIIAEHGKKAECLPSEYCPQCGKDYQTCQCPNKEDLVKQSAVNLDSHPELPANDEDNPRCICGRRFYDHNEQGEVWADEVGNQLLCNGFMPEIEKTSKLGLTASFLQKNAGATTFKTVSTGKNAEDAYNKASRSAEAEYGHGQGYSGAINSTHGFVVLTPPQGVKPKAWPDIVMHSNDPDAKEVREVPYKEGQKCPQKGCKGTITLQPRQVKTQSYEYMDTKPACSEKHFLGYTGFKGKDGKEVYCYWKGYKIKPEVLQEAKRQYARIHDKYGPCGCVKDGARYIFFGWAPE